MNVISSDSSSDESSVSYRSKSSNDLFMEICAISIVLSEQEVKCHRLLVAWDYHATILMHEKQFEVKYHMSYESFMHLAELEFQLPTTKEELDELPEGAKRSVS